MARPPEIILFGPASAPYTEKVRRALLLKGLAHELREPNSQEDYARWSPDTGLLPVITIDGSLTSDSTEILLRLDELFPDPPLLAREPLVATQQRQLEDWADESFLWYFMRWVNFRGETPMGEAAGAPPRATARRTRERSGFFAHHPSLRRLAAWLRAGGTWERPEADLLRGLSDRLDDLVNFLGARPYFYAERISMADLAVYGMLFTLRRDAIPGSQQLLARRTPLVDFMRRIESETSRADLG